MTKPSNSGLKLQDVTILSLVVLASDKPVSAETHHDGAHSVHSNSRYATIKEPAPLSLVSPSVSASVGTNKSASSGSHLVPSNTSFDDEFAVLQNGRQVVVPIEIKSQLIDSALVSDVDVEQRELINRGNRLQIIRSNSKWDTVLVEDVDSDCPSEVAGDLADCMLAL
nr:hypothetical protein CFP56_49112 [Quercus suber]